MAKLLSTAQKTFVDLYDSYNLTLTPDIVSLSCDSNGAVLSNHSFEFKYYVIVGNQKVGATCTIVENPMNFSTTTSASTSSSDGSITVSVSKNATLNGNDSATIKVAVTTGDDNEVTLEKYITFIKVKKGMSGDKGQDGKNGVGLKIYSDQGDTFVEGVETIRLKTLFMDGDRYITCADEVQSPMMVEYYWSYYDKDIQDFQTLNAPNPLNIPITQSYLDITREQAQAMSVFKCTIHYWNSTQHAVANDNEKYRDYYDLNIASSNYDLLVKFFDGNNIFQPGESVVVAYLELYKDGTLVEGIDAGIPYFYHPDNSVNKNGEGYINYNAIDSKYKVAGQRLYIITKLSDVSAPVYQAFLFQCTDGSNWTRCEPTCKYAYTNDLYDNQDMSPYAVPNIIVVSKKHVSRSKQITFRALRQVQDNGTISYDEDLYYANAVAEIIDLNDPVVGDSEPSNATEGQLWLDTSKSPYELKIYQGGQWVYFVQQNGQTVYTSQPNGYSKGDLWILGLNETCNGFSEGSILRAIASRSSGFLAAEWQDAMAGLIELKQNIQQYMKFDPSSGLRIGQQDDKFYVNIESDEMGFYDNTDGDARKVVYISNKSANIDGLTVETSFDVKCSASFGAQVRIGNYVWKQDEYGGLHLSVAKE